MECSELGKHIHTHQQTDSDKIRCILHSLLERNSSTMRECEVYTRNFNIQKGNVCAMEKKQKEEEEEKNKLHSRTECGKCNKCMRIYYRAQIHHCSAMEEEENTHTSDKRQQTAV